MQVPKEEMESRPGDGGTGPSLEVPRYTSRDREAKPRLPHTVLSFSPGISVSIPLARPPHRIMYKMQKHSY